MITLVPKNGFATAEGASEGLGFGDTEAEVALCGENGAGLKALALGFGLKDDAFTFKCFVAVPGDIGVAEEGPVETDTDDVWLGILGDALLGLAFEGAGFDVLLAPLNGGIGWMNMRS